MPSRRRLALLLCVVVLALAGCAGTPSGSDQPTSTETMADDRPTAVPSDIEVVNYTALSDAQRQAFDAALEPGDVTLLDGDAWGAPDDYYRYAAVYESWPGETTDAGDRVTEAFVRRNGTYYRVTFDGPRCCAGPGTDPSLTEIDAPGNRTVTSLDNLTGQAAAYLEYRLAENGDRSGYGVDLPLEDGDVVEYRGAYYEVSGTNRVVDYGTASMSVLELE
ncbi:MULTISPECIES: hypothetical protein [Salinibaculum]|uniref:hypothetical protein n=1 Tax=Salinibaculum TaxID=2732368 RepID=UPI0030CD5C07